MSSPSATLVRRELLEPTESQRRARRHARLGWAAIALGFSLAAGLNAWNLALPRHLLGITEYDDGVYLASALRLVAGHLPYRDYAFVQPPGIAVLLSPVALIAHYTGTRTALGIARVLTLVAAATSAALAGMLVRYRGPMAALVASCLVALFPCAIYASHTLLLEPFLVAFCLLALNLAFSHGRLASGPRLVAAGVALAFATSVKLWAIVIAAALAICLVRRAGALVRLAAGYVAGLVIFLGPFFVFAPTAFIRDVVTSQLLRSEPTATPTVVRFYYLSGLAGLNTKVNLGGAFPLPDVIVAIAGVAVLGLVVLPTLWRRHVLLELVAVVAAVFSSAAMFVSSEFYAHYAYFPVAFSAVSLGLAAGTATELVGAGIARMGRRRRFVSATLLGLVLGASASLIVAALGAETTYIAANLGSGDPGAAIAAKIPRGACTLSDTEVDLIVANRVAESPSCPLVVDATGAWLAIDPHHPVGSRATPPALVAQWREWISEADYLVFTDLQPFRIPWTTGLHRFVDTHFRLVAVKGALVYIRRPVPIPWSQLPPSARRV